MFPPAIIKHAGAVSNPLHIKGQVPVQWRELGSLRKSDRPDPNMENLSHTSDMFSDKICDSV